MRSLHSFNIYLILCSCYFRWFMCALFSPMLVYICNFFSCVHFAFSLASLLLRSSYYSCKFTASNFISLIFFPLLHCSLKYTFNQRKTTRFRRNAMLAYWRVQCKKKSHQYIQPSRVMIKNINDKSMTGPYGLFSLIHIFFSQFFFTFIRYQTVKDSSFFASMKTEITIW